jgi:ABC-2 type transport system permease protein
MNTMTYPVRLGVTRGLLEVRQALTTGQDLFWIILMNGIFIVVLYFQRNSTIEGTSLAMLTLPSLMGMGVATGGYMGIAQLLSFHREDGTLLRAKTVPQGMVGYMVSQLVVTFLNVVLGFVIIVAGLVLLDGFGAVGLAGWLTLLGVTVLGLLATLPWGAIVGSLVKSSASSFGVTFLPISGLIAISGIFYPITALPGWVQGIAQVFPVYWLGLGMRSALLPASAVAAEIGESWRQLETFGVLGAWAVVGLLITPAILRRMARGESGSAMEARKERALHRGY